MRTFARLTSGAAPVASLRAGGGAYPRAVGEPRFGVDHDGAFALCDHFVVDRPGGMRLVFGRNGGWVALSGTEYEALVAADGNAAPPPVSRERLERALAAGVVRVAGRTPAPSEPPPQSLGLSMIVLKVTDRCNIDCTYCYNAETAGNRGERLTGERGEALLRAAIDECDGRLNVVFHGGEPFLELRLLERLCAFASAYGERREKRIRFYVQTNGTVLGEPALAFVKRHGVELGISLDGPGALNALRVDHRGRPALDRIVRGVEAVRRAGLPVDALTVVSAVNVERLPEIVLAFQERGFRSVKFSTFLRQGYGARAAADAPPPEAVVASMCRIVDVIAAGEVAAIHVADVVDLIHRCLFRAAPSMCHKGPCGAGHNMVAAYPSGDVFACDCLVHDDFRLGNLAAGGSLGELTAASPAVAALARRRAATLEPCARCAIAPICGGTMTCHAFWANGALQSVDADECQVNQGLILHLLQRLDDSPRLVDYFLRWSLATAR